MELPASARACSSYSASTSPRCSHRHVAAIQTTCGQSVACCSVSQRQHRARAAEQVWPKLIGRSPGGIAAHARVAGVAPSLASVPIRLRMVTCASAARGQPQRNVRYSGQLVGAMRAAREAAARYGCLFAEPDMLVLGIMQANDCPAADVLR